LLTSYMCHRSYLQRDQTHIKYVQVSIRTIIDSKFPITSIKYGMFFPNHKRYSQKTKLCKQQ